MPEAQRRERKVQELVVRTIIDHRCVVCGEWFTPVRRDARHCSSLCRTRASRKRARNSVRK